MMLMTSSMLARPPVLSLRPRLSHECTHCGENPHTGRRNALRPHLFSIGHSPAFITPNLVINIHWSIQFLVSPPLIPRHLLANMKADTHVDRVCICVCTCMPVNVCLPTWTPCCYCSDFCSPTLPCRSTPSPLSVLVRRPHHCPPLFSLSLCLHSSHSVAHVQGMASCMSKRCTKSLFSTVGHIFICANLCTHALFVTVSHYGGQDFLKWWTLLYWLIIFEIQIFLTVMQNQISENQIIYFCPVRPPIDSAWNIGWHSGHGKTWSFPDWKYIGENLPVNLGQMYWCCQNVGSNMTVPFQLHHFSGSGGGSGHFRTLGVEIGMSLGRYPDFPPTPKPF